MVATHAKEITPVICSASIIASLGAGTTTIAEECQLSSPLDLHDISSYTQHHVLCGVSESVRRAGQSASRSAS